MARSIFDWDLTPWILRGARKALALAGRGVADHLTAPKTDDTDGEQPIPPITPKLQNNSGFILGDGVAKAETEDGHIMIIGGVGSGKSSCIAIPTLLSWRERVFAIDIKGELYAKTRYHPKRNIKVFNPLDPETIGYDPFYILRTATDKTQEAQAIAHALIPLPPNTQEPYWIQSAQNLFTGAILHFYSMGFSFVETITAILEMKPKMLVEEIFVTEEDTRRFVSGFVDMRETALSSVYTVMSNYITVFATNKSVSSALSKAENITPADLENGTDIYINVPEHLLKQWRNLLALMVSQFLTHFEQRPDMGAKPILFLLDEFARLGKIEGIVDGLATLRSKKITIAIILQSLAQLDLHYGREARQVIADTCQYKAVLNVTDVDSQHYFSKAVGTYEKIRVIKTQQYDRLTQFKAGFSVATMLEEKPIIKPHEFASLEQIVLLTPYGAFKVDKKPYYTAETAVKNEDSLARAISAERARRKGKVIK